MSVVLLRVYRRLIRAGRRPRGECLRAATVREPVDEVATALARVRYDVRAAELLGFGVTPSDVLGPRP